MSETTISSRPQTSSHEERGRAPTLHPGHITHHGAVNGVTGSCHQLFADDNNSILIDCGLFQGAETSPGGRGQNSLEIEFDITTVRALVVTHVHIDHVGRIPYLIAAGFRGPIYCSEPSAELLPLVLEDALKIGFTRDRALIEKFIGYVQKQLRPLPYNCWQPVIEDSDCSLSLSVRLQRAGHILGSAYVECELDCGAGAFSFKTAPRSRGGKRRIIFSGDLGAPNTPLLYAPKAPWGCDELVIESTYGDRLHQNRKERVRILQRAIEEALADGGSVLIPAFSIGRTQELLYELEGVIHSQGHDNRADNPWRDLPVIVDSPLASRFTDVYRRLRPFWDAEARQLLRRGRHPLSFEQLITVDDHEAHRKVVAELASSRRPAIVIAASGMCSGGRVVNYLKAMLEDKRHNILFVGYQARGTPGRDIQVYGPRNGYVDLDGQRYRIAAGVETISGYSAHADKNDLLGFIRKMKKRPQCVRVVHGDDRAKAALKAEIEREELAGSVIVPR
ncbi:MBL fold metallo-hydrolase RNA specificity domain-containing protein [Microbulbifer celer]|uniref:MBL fold metallo-hydrolase RNA specificity domain-containing protein n=1 Tax=Microbulbifer celer TaxID=435905 RepID=A0ABW3U3N4_9GAMM|nr:MBL fold metallo-hydrolase [Microbulbifer celer]UFN57878.1 MBL fold metallo-hydrolase [Microbulbifer celer]